MPTGNHCLPIELANERRKKYRERSWEKNRERQKEFRQKSPDESIICSPDLFLHLRSHTSTKTKQKENPPRLFIACAFLFSSSHSDFNFTHFQWKYRAGRKRGEKKKKYLERFPKINSSREEEEEKTHYWIRQSAFLHRHSLTPGGSERVRARVQKKITWTHFKDPYHPDYLRFKKWIEEVFIPNL